MELVSLGPIGERLKEERERLKLSVAEFSASAGVSDRTQRNYEAGQRLPDAKYLFHAGNMGADVDYILTGQRTGWRTLAESVQKECEVLERIVFDVEEMMRARDLHFEPAQKARVITHLYRAARWGAPTTAQAISEVLTLAAGQPVPRTGMRG